MRIHNIRAGFACNSSSTHSIILIPKDSDIQSDPWPSDGDFGWGNFILADNISKSLYLAATLNHNLKLPQEAADMVVEKITGMRKRESPEEYFEPWGMIDHQSLIALPTNWTGDMPNLEFFEDFKHWLLNDRVIVLGGNDNGDSPKIPKGGEVISHNLPEDNWRGAWVARKDPRGFWTLFSRKDGTRIRVTSKMEKVAPEKATYPELVDLKITNYCERGCDFCYQNSTRQGKHADIDVINRIIAALGEMKVFEVALGGGEPTSHPKFDEIVKSLKDHHIVPNLTTRNIDWLDKVSPETFNSLGGIAFSVDRYRSASDWIRKVTENKQRLGLGYYDNKFSIQVILGVQTVAEIKKEYTEATEEGFRFMVLGFKDFGRGEKFKRVPEKGWTSILKNNYNPIGVDSKVIQDYKVQLKRLEINPIMYTENEGKFSMYIDAVENMFAKSSFTNEKYTLDTKDYKETHSILAKEFDRW